MADNKNNTNKEFGFAQVARMQNSFHKIDGTKKFVEFSFAYFEKNGSVKTLLHFADYDPEKESGERIKSQIDIYLDKADLFLLIGKMKSGILLEQYRDVFKKRARNVYIAILKLKANHPEPAKVEADLKKLEDKMSKDLSVKEMMDLIVEYRTKYDIKDREDQVALFAKSSGVSAKKLAEQRRSRPDGKDESKIFDILVNSTESKYSIIFQASMGPGKENASGLIQAAGKPESKIALYMTFEDLTGLIALLDTYMNAYASGRYASNAMSVEMGSAVATLQKGMRSLYDTIVSVSTQLLNAIVNGQKQQSEVKKETRAEEKSKEETSSKSVSFDFEDEEDNIPEDSDLPF